MIQSDGGRWWWGFQRIVLVLFAIVYILPIYATFTTAFRSLSDLLTSNLWALPKSVYFGGFHNAWVEQRLAIHARNTVIIAVPALLIAISLSSLVAYAVAHIAFSARRVIFFLFVSALFFPPQIFVIPVFQLAKALGIYDTYWGLILVHSAYSLPFSVLMLTTFFGAIPAELLDAGRIDGASELRLLLEIVVPLSRNAFATVMIFLFTWIWNDFFWGLVMSQSPSVQPIMIGILNATGRLAFNWNGQSAAALIASTPPVIAFVFLQRLFSRGVMLGSLKQ